MAEQPPPASPRGAAAPLPPGLAKSSGSGASLPVTRSSRKLSFHESVDKVTEAAPEASKDRASRLRATTSMRFKTMLVPQNRSMLRSIEKHKAEQKLQAQQLADLQLKLERNSRVVDATISPADLTERGPLSSAGAQGEVSKAVWKRMIPVAIKENKSGEWAGDLTAEMQLFLDLHHPHVVACYGILKEPGKDGQTVNSIVTEKCSISLDHFLRDNSNWEFHGSNCLDQINMQKSTILLHVSQGLSKLHDMNVLHRDIKCGNVLLDGAPGECPECHHSGNWKICDFGEAKVLKPPYVRFAKPLKWREGYAHNLVERNRFLPVTSTFLRSKGARFYCYIKPGEKLSSTLSSEEWTPCPHGGFAYLFGDLEMTEEKVLSNFDERSCVFPQTLDDASQQHVELEFPHHLKQFGILPIKYRPFLDLEDLTYEMPTSITGWLAAQGLGDAERIKQWDTIEQELGHRCGLQNTLVELAQLEESVIYDIAAKMELHGSTAKRMVQAHQSLCDLTDSAILQLAGISEIVGDSIKGQISDYCSLDALTDSDRRKAHIPVDATHYVWAYQAEGVDAEKLSDEHKKLMDLSSGEFAFASLGCFIYFKSGPVDHPPVVLGVNALGVGTDQHSGTVDRDGDDNSVTATIASPEMWDGKGIGLETDIYAFGIVMWEVWTRCFAWHWMGSNAEFQICNRVGILKQRPRMPPFIGTQASKIATMIRMCLHDNPAKRPTAAKLVEAQLEIVKKIEKGKIYKEGPVRERNFSPRQTSHNTALDSEPFWTSAGQFTLHPNRLDSDSGRFELTVTDPDRNEWIENALVGDEEEPAELEAAREKTKEQKLGIVFKTVNKRTGEKTDHWPKVARVDDGLLASAFPEIRVNVKLEQINGQPVPPTFKEAVPLLKKRPFTLQFSTVEDAVESVLAPSKTYGVHAPMVAAAVKGGIQAAFLVKRYEEGRSHRVTRARLQEAEQIIARKDAELEKLKAQVLALEGTIKQTHDSLGSVPNAPPKAPGS